MIHGQLTLCHVVQLPAHSDYPTTLPPISKFTIVSVTPDTSAFRTSQISGDSGLVEIAKNLLNYEMILKLTDVDGVSDFHQVIVTMKDIQEASIEKASNVLYLNV